MNTAEAATREYDYVIVGGGSAGCALAARLSEDSSVEVLLIERGPRYRRMVLGVPLLGMKFASGYLRSHWTAPQQHCDGRTIHLPVASAIGGGSSVNAMMYVRGEPRAYDRWTEAGAHGWSFADVLPYFRRMENFDGIANEYHGVGGPLGVSGTRYKSRFGQAFIDACVEMGLPRNHDFTGAAQAGAGFFQYTQSDGERSSTAQGYLSPAASRRNLHVLSGTDTDALILSGSRAVGVRCRRRGLDFAVHAGREVVLTAGAFGSPRLLLRSGIGPADELRSLGIEVKCDSQRVGRGLQDHPRCSMLYQPNHPVPLHIPALALPFLHWCKSRDGIFTSTTIAAGAFVRLSEASDLLDCQFAAKWAGSPPDRAAVDFQPCLINVASRGSVRLTSADPSAELQIDPNYLSAPGEVELLIEGIRFARRLAGTGALREFGLVRELSPGPNIQSDADLAGYVRASLQTCYHPVGTCAMGRAGLAVVDSELRVHGIDQLRVADASIMPRLINGNTNGPTIMIAEKAADLIRAVE